MEELAKTSAKIASAGFFATQGNRMELNDILLRMTTTVSDLAEELRLLREYLAQTPGLYGCGVFLRNSGMNRIQVIKILRTWLYYGLRESKELAESPPIVIKGLEKKQAYELANQLTEAGALAHYCEEQMCPKCNLRFACYTSRIHNYEGEQSGRN